MSFNLEALTAEVKRVQTVQFSAVTLLKRLTTELEDIHAKLEASSTADAAPLGELITSLKASTDSLAAAVADSSDAKAVVRNAEDTMVSTAQIVMPEVLSVNVEVKAEQI
jgi:hypothetical protein